MKLVRGMVVCWNDRNIGRERDFETKCRVNACVVVFVVRGFCSSVLPNLSKTGVVVSHSHPKERNKRRKYISHNPRAQWRL